VPELVAFDLGLQLLRRASIAQGVCIALLSDSTCALGALAGFSRLSQQHALVFRLRDALACWNRLTLQYVPSHLDVHTPGVPPLAGNVCVDMLAAWARVEGTAAVTFVDGA